MKLVPIALFGLKSLNLISATCSTDSDCTGPYSTCVNSQCECTVTPTVSEVAALDFTQFTTVTCTANGIQVKVDQCAVEAGRFQLSELYLDGIVENEVDPSDPNNLDVSGQNSCTGTLVNDNAGPFMQFDIASPISDCGTDVTSNATHHSFKNAIQGYQGVQGSVITRKRKFFLTFECVYPVSTEISADYAVNAILTELRFVMDEQVGEYTANFELFEDNLYTTPLVSGADVWVPDYFYGRVVAEVPDADRYVTKVSMCWATPTSDPADSNNVAFINNRK